MTFKHLAEYFSRLEATTLRNKMTEVLAELFKEAQAEEIGKLCYLLQGRVAPLFTAIEFGMADKMVIRAIARGTGVDREKVEAEFGHEGDLGKSVEKLKTKISKPAAYDNSKINDVYDVLYKVATAGGKGSQDTKIKLLGDLLSLVDPLSARYIVRITLAKLRLGFSDMTILDSLSWMLSGSKKCRLEIERAYNVRPDLGFISRTVKEKGIEGLKDVTPKVGIPILMARAERMTTGEDIILKIGRCAIEPKYDGFRLQCHLDGEEIRLFSRNLENVTSMYPDIVQGIKSQIKARVAILEGEAIAFNPNTHEYLPFQETVQRKRKYNIEAKAKEVPLKLFAFELLFIDGESLLTKSYTHRRRRLEQTVAAGNTILMAQEDVTDDAKKLEEIFNDAVTRGLEGVMAKKLDGIYRAGARDFNWIKYKRSYAGKLADTIDAVVMGYDLGQGKRLGFGIGDFLIGVYDRKRDMFVTVSKIGTGLTDIEWKKIKASSDKLKIKDKPQNYDVDRMMECDVWITPSIVVEIRADEITRSPVHTAGRMMTATKSGNAMEVKEAGYALRFPRLERFRDDRRASDITTVSEVEKMYKKQGR